MRDDDLLDGEFRLDQARVDALLAAERDDGSAAERDAGATSRRALARALADSGLSEQAGAPTARGGAARRAEQAGWWARVGAWLRSPASIVTAAAVAVAILVTWRLAGSSGPGDDPLAWAGSEPARRVMLSCRPGTVARSEMTPRGGEVSCERDGVKHGWRMTWTPGQAPALTCWREGAEVDAGACGP